MLHTATTKNRLRERLQVTTQPEKAPYYSDTTQESKRLHSVWICQLERFVDPLNAMSRIPTIASATGREGYTYPTEVRDIVAREQAEQQQRIGTGHAYASLVQQVLGEEAKTGDAVLVGRGGQLVPLPFYR